MGFGIKKFVSDKIRRKDSGNLTAKLISQITKLSKPQKNGVNNIDDVLMSNNIWIICLFILKNKKMMHLLKT